MYPRKLKVFGFKALREFEMDFGPRMNVIVGNNESGKTTIIEAISLALSSQVLGSNIQYELNPYHFNASSVDEYYEAIGHGENPVPPRILIEVYLDDEGTDELAKLRGTNNTDAEDCPGICLEVAVKEDYAEEFLDYIHDAASSGLIPIEYYEVSWLSFASNPVNARARPFRATVIDTGAAPRYSSPNRYLSHIIKECLDEPQRIALAAAYRDLRQRFAEEPGIDEINEFLRAKKGDISTKTLTVSLDMSARSTWDTSITAHLDDIPFAAVGKGEQSCVQMKLAIGAAETSSLLLIEEPENHLSHSTMSRLVEDIAQRENDRQVIITTHSSFVLNKLGISHVQLMTPDGVMTLADLDPDTVDYFSKLPGYDTLRLLLARRAILVEGPSDELIVQRAYRDVHGRLPLADGVDVISVGTACKRFLEIAARLELDVAAVVDNDRDVEKLKKRFEEYLSGKHPSIEIFFDSDEGCPTLEPQMLKANSLETLNALLGTTYENGAALLASMTRNKTDWALRLFRATALANYPAYIRDAVGD